MPNFSASIAGASPSLLSMHIEFVIIALDESCASLFRRLIPPWESEHPIKSNAIQPRLEDFWGECRRPIVDFRRSAD